MTDAYDLLAAASVVAIIDWPQQDVPASLVRAGLTVVAPRYPPEDSASEWIVHEVVAALPGPEAGRTFPLDDGSHLVFRSLDSFPERIDVVSTYRPAEEQPGIVDDAIAWGAKAVWVEPPAESSEEARAKAKAAGLMFVDGTSIAATARAVAPG